MSRFWQSWEVKFVREHYPDVRTDRIASALERSVGAVHQKARALGLNKSPTFLATQAGRMDGTRGARFPKGHATWNKGIAYNPGGRCAETQFKPGNKPQTWRPIGTERACPRDGYLLRKVADAPNKEGWQLVHHLVWVEHHGPIPADHIIVFKDGNTQNVAIDNLECISFAENMKRNTVHRLPKDIAEVCQLLGALNRKINKGLV